MSFSRQLVAVRGYTLRSMTLDSRTVVQAAWRAFASHDAEQIAAFFTTDAEWLAPSGNATAVALNGPSHMVGRAAITQFLANDFPRLFVADVVVDFHGFYADGNRVIVEETMSATLANGNRYVNDYCLVFELRDGLIHRVREYLDTARGHRDFFGDSATTTSGDPNSRPDHEVRSA
ncbi:nuclear transport factor 2 family protein [Nocardia sp. CY41]|uniref:nuclear transport factor 2 family protein n=1 Tax=Nocardia sp. CY41 TaxID=2608686 RepID=UPI001F31240D|nr:nuclear transport factor 2 family protein [Nocardia sp. CY41]